MDQYNKLVTFKEKNGHTRVPIKDYKALREWIYTQQSNQRLGTLRQDRVQLLNDIGFVWRKTESEKSKAWMDMYNRLNSFKQENGQFKVSVDADTETLREWISCQQKCKRTGTLSQDRQELLAKIGFWDLREPFRCEP